MKQVRYGDQLHDSGKFFFILAKLLVSQKNEPVRKGRGKEKVNLEGIL